MKTDNAMQLKAKINKSAKFKTALEMTCKHRGTEKVLAQIQEIISAIRESDNLKDQWQKYKKKMPCASEIDFSQTVDKIEELLKTCM